MFRAEKVDAVVWQWVKSLLTDPTKLKQGLNEYQERKEEELAPLKERLNVIEDLLTNNRTQLNRLLDLYLNGDFPKEMLAERKKQLEMTINRLEIEKTTIEAHLKTCQLSEDQLQVLQGFASVVGEELEDLENDFDGRYHLIELLDVRATLAIENNEKVIYVRCILDEKSFSGFNNHQSWSVID